MSGHARTRDMGTSPSVFVEAHIKGRPKKKRASPSKSRKMLLPGMVELTWRTLPVSEKIAWVKEVKDIEEERRRSPLSMAAAAPPGPSTVMVPSSMPSSSSDAIVKNENDGVTYLGEPLLECTFAFGGSKRKQRGNFIVRPPERSMGGNGKGVEPGGRKGDRLCQSAVTPGAGAPARPRNEHGSSVLAHA